jgi:outer membrane biosynthesis protein TonB
MSISVNRHISAFYETSFVPYAAPKEPPFVLFLALSLFVLCGSTEFLARVITVEKPVKTLSVELAAIDGAVNEPPPLGEPNPSTDLPKAEAPAQPEEVQKQPETVPEQEIPAPVEKVEETPTQTIPEPISERLPEPITELLPPPPPAPPEFVAPTPVPEPTATPLPSPPPPKPEVLKKPALPKIVKPAPKAVSAENSIAQTAPTSQPPAGSPVGVAGGRGGSHGDFVATPHPAYDTIAQQRGYEGVGDVLITYQDGAITAVTMTKSTGVSYLDTRTTIWVKTRYRVKPGTSGQAAFKITWVLPH